MLVTWELLGWELVEVPSRRHAHDLGPTQMDLFDSFKGGLWDFWRALA